MSLFSEKLNPQNEDDTDHFENIQSTNWQTMRFKPPPPNSSIGWRVEFRPCDLQFTDFENAAICCFVVILTRVILSFKYSLMIPISYVDKNMERAQKRDAVLDQKFYFRRNINTVDGCSTKETNGCEDDMFICAAPLVDEMSLDEIFNGSQDKGFPGLIALIKEYLSNLEVDTDTACTLGRYFDYLGEKAAGKLRTNARFMRDFVRKHPDYKQDSVVNEKIQYDLLSLIDKIQKDERKIRSYMKPEKPLK